MWTMLTVTLLCFLANTNEAKILNLRPIIGVLAQETSDTDTSNSYIIASYVKWSEAAGARVVPIKINERDEYYEDIFKRINGVLLPGGSVNVMTSYHAQAAKKLYKMALKANDEGDHFPIWGTCQGLQLLTALTAGENLLAYRPYNGPLPITFKHDFRNSRLFQNIPDNVRRALANENVTSNLHDYGLTPQNFSENCLLNTFYRVMSTNFDRNGKEYISSMEAVNYPFYGVQFHPEKNVYNWDLHFVNNHDAHAIQVAHYFADFFLAEARQSYHSFPTVNEEVRALIDNHQPVFSEDDTFQDIYYFNFRT